MTSLIMNPRSTAVSRVLPKSKSSMPRTGIPFVNASGGSRRGLQDRDSQHGGSLTDTRTEKASSIEFSALVPGSLIVVHINLLAALRDVTGKQTCPREAEQIDQYELLVSDEDLRNWVRWSQEAAAVISSRENLPESIYKLESGFGWEGPTLLLRDRIMRSAFRRIAERPFLFRSLPQIRCLSQGLLMRPWSLCMRCLSKSTVVPFPESRRFSSRLAQRVCEREKVGTWR